MPQCLHPKSTVVGHLESGRGPATIDPKPESYITVLYLQSGSGQRNSLHAQARSLSILPPLGGGGAAPAPECACEGTRIGIVECYSDLAHLHPGILEYTFCTSTEAGNFSSEVNLVTPVGSLRRVRTPSPPVQMATSSAISSRNSFKCGRIV